MQRQRVTGVVIRVFPNKGYGFVRDINSSLTRFFHVNDFVDPIEFDQIHEGLKLQYKPMKENGSRGHNGLKAIEVTKC